MVQEAPDSSEVINVCSPMRNRRATYEGFVMGRQYISPCDYGVDLGKEELTDILVEELGRYTQGMMSFDEMLLRPRMALHFCDTVRQAHGWFDLPDDIILRLIMIRRKNPSP